MIDINFIKEYPEKFSKLMQQRNASISIENILKLDKDKKLKISELQKLQTERNSISKLIGAYKKDQKETVDLEKKVTEIKRNTVEIEKSLKIIEEKLNQIILSLPNIPDEDVPIGENERNNIEILKKFTPIDFKFDPIPHDILGKNLNKMMDFELGSSISGARFVILKSDLALLERALINFMLDLHVHKHNYTEVSAPHIVKKDTLIGTGQLPKFEDDLFKVSDDKWLIPTAEVTLTNFFKDRILNQKDLPIRLVAQSSCYRSEAGSAGQDTKGMIRLHEFKKVELVSLVEKNKSDEELERLLKCASKVLDLLELPYRVVKLCTGDIGFSACKTYDIEVWLPSQNKYREISSCSNCRDFQARRIKTRYKDSKGNKEFVHTLNGSGLAVGRTLLAILENNQIDENIIKVPDILVDYMNGKKEISTKNEQ